MKIMKITAKIIYTILFILTTICNYLLFTNNIGSNNHQIAWSFILFLLDPIVILLLLIIIQSSKKLFIFNININANITIILMFCILFFIEYNTTINISFIILCLLIFNWIHNIKHHLFE